MFRWMSSRVAPNCARNLSADRPGGRYRLARGPDPAKTEEGGPRALGSAERRGGSEGEAAVVEAAEVPGGWGSRLNLGRRSRLDPEAILPVGWYTDAVGGEWANRCSLRRSKSWWNCWITAYNLSDALSGGRSWVGREAWKRRMVPSAARNVPGSSGGGRGRSPD